jgi:hypothetical protein
MTRIVPDVQTSEAERRRRPSRAIVAALAAACAAIAAQRGTAEEIYRWVDADGGVHYSDAPPAQELPVTVLEVETAPRAPDIAADDPYSILNQAARTHERWLEIEAVRQARAEQQAEALANRVPPEPQYYDGYHEYSTWPYYSNYGYWRGQAPDYRPGQGRQQIYAMHTLDLLGPRPASINSGVHQDRVARSQFLPLVPPPAPPPRPTPR